MCHPHFMTFGYICSSSLSPSRSSKHVWCCLSVSGKVDMKDEVEEEQEQEESSLGPPNSSNSPLLIFHLTLSK